MKLSFSKQEKKKEESDLKKVKVAEVAHSIFYAPQYVAHKLGYFEEEGLDVEIILTSGADKVTSAVLSGDVNIGFCGSEATIYVYNEGEKDYLINFAALTKRDGSFLVSREKYDNFTLGDLKGKKIIGGRKGGMPEMTLEWALKQNGIDPKSDVKIALVEPWTKGSTIVFITEPKTGTDSVYFDTTFPTIFPAGIEATPSATKAFFITPP